MAKLTKEEANKIRKAEEEASYKEEEKAIKEAEKRRKKAFEKGKLTREEQKAYAKERAAEAIQKQKLKDYIKAQKLKAKPKKMKILYTSPYSSRRIGIKKPVNIVQPETDFFAGLGGGVSAGIENFQQNGLKPQIVGRRQIETEDMFKKTPVKEEFSDFTREEIIRGSKGRGRPKKIENLTTEELRARVAALQEREELRARLAEEELERQTLLRETPEERKGMGLDIDIMGWGRKSKAPGAEISPPSLDIGTGGFDLSIGSGRIGSGRIGNNKKRSKKLSIDFW